jgi:two-component system, NarL family, response regulator DesR
MDGTPVPAQPARQAVQARPDPGEHPRIRVLIGEDVAVVRETLAALLGLEPGIEVAAALASGDRVVPAALEHRPDVALLDIGLPGTDGLTTAAELRQRCPGCRVLILTGLEAPGNLDAAMRAGARGFLLKDGPAGELIDAVRAVARGERVLDRRLAGRAPGWDDDPAPA